MEMLVKVVIDDNGATPTMTPKALISQLRLCRGVLTVTRLTEKQIVSGYHRPVCKKCLCELHPETNGVGVLDMADWGPYELYDADLWKCPKCGIEVVGGFALGPISRHFESDFQKMVKGYEEKGLIIKNTG